jgi:hypothetical protein
MLLYFMILLATSSDHPCLALDGFSTDAVANSRMIKRKRGHGNSTSVGTLYAGHEKSARTKVHMCSQRRVTLRTLLEFTKQRNKIRTTVLTIFYTFNHSVQTHILLQFALPSFALFFTIFTFCIFSFRTLISSWSKALPLLHHLRLGQLPPPLS